jgi:hypothetical protein
MRYLNDRIEVRNGRRIIFAFLVSPLAVPIVFVIGNFAIQRSYHHVALEPAGLIYALLLAAIYSLPVAYSGEVLFSLPMWLVFRRFGVRSIFAFALGGALIGFVSYQLFSLIMYQGFQSTIEAVEYVLTPGRWINLPGVTAVIGGLLGGIIFQYISFFRVEAGR